MKRADTRKVRGVKDDMLIVAIDVGMEMNRGYCTTPDGRSTIIGYERGMVVYGKDANSGYGMDELPVSGETGVLEFTRHSQSEYTLHPEDEGLKQIPFDDIASLGNPASESLRFVRVLSGKKLEACIDFTCLNAGAILYIADKSDSFRKGVEMSREAIEKNRAIEKLRKWIMCQDASGGNGLHCFELLLERSEWS